MKGISRTNVGYLIISLSTIFSLPLFAAWVPPKIDKATINVNVSYLPNSEVYQYNYTIENSQDNAGNIETFSVAASGKHDKTVTDSFGDGSLHDDYSTVDHLVVGVDSAEHWESSISLEGTVTWVPENNNYFIAPGTNASGYTIYSKAPPGLRDYQLTPYVDMGPGTPYDMYKEGCGGTDPRCPPAISFWVKGKVIGPTVPAERTLIDGKGQRSADVNKFLRYANPADSTTVNLPLGTSRYPLAVVFGEYVQAPSFTAVLNGIDISSQFNVAPTMTSVVNLPLQNGRNKLILSINGTRSDGRSSTDTDQLTFIVK